MGWMDDIRIARSKIKEIAEIPIDDESKDKQIDEVLSKVWRAALDYNPAWDAD